MDLRDLQYFRAVVQAGHVGRAAEALRLTQPAVSKSIARLEAAVGAPLLLRTARGVTPTTAGAALHARAEQIAAAVDGALREAAALGSGSAGTLRIGTGPMAGEHLLPDVCASMLAASRGLSIRLVVALNDVLFAGLDRGELDAVFASIPEPLPDAFRCEVLADDELGVVARRGHPLERARRIRLERLRDARWALPNPAVASRRILERVFADRGLPLPAVSIEANSTPVLAAAVARTDLLSYLPARMARGASGEGGELVRLDVPAVRVRRRLGVVLKRNAYVPPVVERLTAALRAALA